MQKLQFYQVDAFTDRLFSGNPAGVCIMDNWISDGLMQSIANENNLAETAFVVPSGNDFMIRWFTPAVEVDLCGHATLASAFVLFSLHHYPESLIKFHSRNSGLLQVVRNEDLLILDFPADRLELCEGGIIHATEEAIGATPLEMYRGKSDYLAVVDSESTVRDMKPDFEKISRLDSRGLIVTSRGDSVDFVSRFFAPNVGINEDPVTGSAHTSLIPLWSEKLGKKELVALQLSERGGRLFCELKNDRCHIGGNARLYLKGEIYLPPQE